MDFWSYLGLVMVSFVAIRLLLEIGKSVPIIELMLLIAGLQWVVGPIIEYSSPSFHFKYYMYVDQDRYMSFVSPAYILFSIISLIGLRKRIYLRDAVVELKRFKNYGVSIFLIGVLFDLISGFVPGSLGFFVFIVSNFKYAGAIILFFSEDKRLKQIFYGAIVYLLIDSIRNALFHDLVLWSVFFFLFWAVKYKPTKKTVLLIVFAGLMSLTTLQTIKAAYRAQVWNGYSGNKFELFYSLIVDAIFLEGTYEDEDNTESNNIRLNQGWIISAIIDHVPKNVGYAGGSTVKEAFFASILPRFLNPNKKKAGGQENFERYTGLLLGENTSMGISIIGESYANYGIFWGAIFMGLWGFILVRIWLWLSRLALKNNLIVAFMPLVFLQVVKAETELVVVLNHLIKSLIVVFAFFWATRRFLNWNFSVETSH